jgi:hypothetical protein
MKKRFFSLLFIIVVLLSIVFLNTNYIKFPVKIAQALVNTKVETKFVPFQFNKNYATIRNCGRNCDYISIHYEGSKESLIITATKHVSWANDPKWNEQNKIKGTKYYYYIDKSGTQYISWREEEKHLELEIEYRGKKPLPVKTLLKVANSVEVKI